MAVSMEFWRNEINQLFDGLKSEQDDLIRKSAALTMNIQNPTDMLQTYLLIQILRELRKSDEK